MQLLVPVLRQQARDLVGEKDFVLAVFRLVEGVAADRRYAAAFNQEPPFPSTPTSSALESLGGPRRGLADVVRGAFQSLNVWLRGIARHITPWRTAPEAQFPGSTATPAPAILDPEPTLAPISAESDLPTIIPTAARIGECGYTMELIVTCRDGFLRDASGAARGICPWCLGKA